MQPLISVIICTHNPRSDYLAQVLESLQSQSLSQDCWELLLIDNASESSLQNIWQLDWHSQGRIIREDTIGLTAARIRGLKEAQGEILVFVDDDNLLTSNYLVTVADTFQHHPQMGAIGGKSTPQFEAMPEPWMAEFYQVLAIRDFGDQVLATDVNTQPVEYPSFAPAGIGLAIRRQVFSEYVHQACVDTTRLSLGRTGKQLTSGEDNDIVLTVMASGWQVGYFPKLQITHLIAANRLRPKYLAQLNQAATRSWVQVLQIHNLQIWPTISPWTVLPRKIKAFFAYGAWRNVAAYIRWRGACGLYEALAMECMSK